MSISAINGVTPQIKPKKEKIYQRTDFFKKAGASAGAITGLGAFIVGRIKKPPMAIELSKTKLALIGVGVTVAGAIAGAIAGILPDFTINKTVENTVLSLKKDNA